MVFSKGPQRWVLQIPASQFFKTGSLKMPQFPPLTAPSGKSFNAIHSHSTGSLSVACRAVGGDSPEASRRRLNFLFSSGVLGHRPCNPEVGQRFHWGLCQPEATPSLQRGWDSVIECILCVGSHTPDRRRQGYLVMCDSGFHYLEYHPM